MMSKTAFFTDERTFWHTGGTHALFFPIGGWVQPPSSSGYAESPDSKRRLLALIQTSGLAASLDMQSAALATEEDLLRVHPRDYLNRFKALSDTTGGDLGELAPFGKGSYEIAALSAGLAIGAIDTVLEKRASNAFSLSRPPGHHCLRDKPMGFCLLANIPIAIEAARAKHGVERVAVIDWDVHHGNGTQSIYYDDPNTLTISLHQDRCFPPGYSGADERGAGAGTGANLNIPLLPGGGHERKEKEGPHSGLETASSVSKSPLWCEFAQLAYGVLSDPRARFLIDCNLKTHRLQQEKIGIGPWPAHRCYAIFQGSGGLLWKVLGIKNRAKSGCLDA